ncbi:MAG: PHB depolymerase family esterase [Gammaproteobacteria bacterium]
MNDSLASLLAALQADLLAFLRALDGVQQDIRFDDVGAAQRALAASGTPALARAAARVADITASEDADGNALGDTLRAALDHLLTADAAFRRARDPAAFGAAFIGSRRHHCRALELLYRQRAALPLLESCFRLDDPLPGPDTGGGIRHVEAAPGRAAYSLYVPEYYEPTRRWPLIVCLHGAFGHGEEYLWTWLRVARSRGYLLLAPKSAGPTWSILRPELDGAAILGALDEVLATCAVDPARVHLSGLSDGGTFAWLLGLAHAERFAALAPIAGVLPPGADGLLREGRGRELPLHVVHGVHDTIFPVATIRSTCALLERLGYALTYTELPDWGHALTERINENVLLPWFESLPAPA